MADRAATGTPEIVVLCGSTRFVREFERANLELTLAGRIVLSVAFQQRSQGDPGTESGEGIGIPPEVKAALDELHRRKIDLANRVHVLNVGGYVGESTAAEIRYARERGKPITWLEGDE